MVIDRKTNYFGDWCEITTFGGVIDWYQSNRIGKCFWFVIIVILFMLTVWQNKDGAVDYFGGNNYQTSVSVEPQSQILFPNVTICNFNRAILSKISNISTKVLSYAFNSFPLVYDFPMEWFNVTEYEHAWNTFITQNPNMSDLTVLMTAIGSDCAATFMQCKFAGMNFACCDRVTEIVNGYGKCFMISPPALAGTYPTQIVPGSSEGLKLVLVPHLDEYPPDLFVSNLLESGFVVTVSYVYEPNVPQPLTLGAGTHTWISLSAQKETISKPQILVQPLPCRQNPELKLLAVPYSKSNCFFDCSLQTSLKYCGCVPYSNYQVQHPICNASFYSTCTSISAKPITQMEAKNCRKDCLSPCEDTMTVTSRVSTTKYPYKNLTSSILDYVKQAGFEAVTEDDIASVSSVDIFFPQLEILTVETFEVTSFFTFISNVGGNLGLWLGISLTTAYQIIYQIIEWIVQKFCIRK